MTADTLTHLAHGARRAAAVAALHAADADAERRLDPAVVAELTGAGFARHFVPLAHGGREGTFAELTEAVAVLGGACVSAAWVAGLSAAVSRMAAHLPEKGRAEVWADGPDAFIVAAQASDGTAEETDGGWVVRGSWPYVSAVEYADWALVRARETGEVGTVRYFAVPRTGFRVEHTWQSVGMRGTGSHTLVVDEAVVPLERTFRQDDLLRGESGLPAACHRVPLAMVSGLTFTAPALGAARALLTGDHPLVRRLAAGPAGSASQVDLLWSRGEVDAAGLLLERAAVNADTAVPDAAAVARGGRDCAVAARFLASAVDRLFRAAGTAAHQETDVMQRVWRDVTCELSHRSLNAGTHAAVHAEGLAAPAAALSE
ncbi:acyl-CoA dehydrogenase family protein [Streptomyces sp. NPDC051576]|uniref:acyl-CoA dehydrogenase family protein n=1 Tax=Streptomyces sp. NPDC051576 TaxID=3155803 RepID=UPI00343CAD97